MMPRSLADYAPLHEHEIRCPAPRFWCAGESQEVGLAARGALPCGIIKNNMFWTIFYFAISYLTVAAIVLGGEMLFRALQWRHSSRWVLFATLLFVPLFPYAKVALQTSQYQTQLLPALHSSAVHWGSPPETFHIVRVLGINSSRAEVYVVTSCQGGMGSSAKTDRVGDIIGLTKTAKGWKFTDYDTVWSDCGSAEGNTFPPYPEAREF